MLSLIRKRTPLILLGLLVALVLSALAVPVLAQEGELPPEQPVNWLAYAALLLNAVLVPLAADALKRVWGKAPSFIKSVVPLVAGSLFMLAETYLLEALGVPVDLALIEQVLLGAGGGSASTLAFKWGEHHARN